MAEVVSTNQFKTGMAIEIDGQPFTIVDFQHVKPGKGGAFVRTKVRNIQTGAVLDKTFRAGEKSSACTPSRASWGTSTPLRTRSSSWTTRPTSRSP